MNNAGGRSCREIFAQDATVSMLTFALLSQTRGLLLAFHEEKPSAPTDLVQALTLFLGEGALARPVKTCFPPF